jgi:signal transduction histidine kinase
MLQALAPTPSPDGSGLPITWRHLMPMALTLAFVMGVGQAMGYFIWGKPSLHGAFQVLFVHFVISLVRSAGIVWLITRLLPIKAALAADLRYLALGQTFLAALLFGSVVDMIAMAVFSSDAFSNFFWRALWHVLCANLVLVVAVMAVAVHGARARVAAAQLERSALQRRGQGRELDDARMQLLQAQAEPHFLFNALANVRRLLRTESPAAKAMLGDLLQYLQVALPALRESETTLGKEADLVRAYLAIHQVRMGGRLTSVVDIPAELSDARIPSLALLTLVENAIKHGVGPLVEGGSITVSAQADGDTLRLSVSDTGKGMGSGSGGGTGLANLRMRLKAMFGSEARLSLALNEPRGMIASVEAPLRARDGSVQRGEQ